MSTPIFHQNSLLIMPAFLHLIPLNPNNFTQTPVPTEPAVLAKMGYAMVDILEVTILYTLFYGLFILLFFQSTISFLQRDLTRPNQRLMFSAITFTFILATVIEAILIVQLSIIVHFIFFNPQDIPLANRLLKNTTLNVSLLVDLWVNILQIIISDSIVVWRAFVLLQHRQHLKILPLLLLLVSTVMFLVYLIPSSTSLDVSASTSIFVVAVVLSLGTNIISTSLIAYIYWVHRQDIKTLFQRRKQPLTQGQRVLAILVESGVVFCLLQATFLAIEFSQVKSLQDLYLQQLFTTIFRGYVAIYPTLVIVLVKSHKSFDQVYLMGTLPDIMFGPPSDTSILQPISFALTPPVPSAGISS